ncbi:MAG: hypothetical protein ACLFQK_11145 [Fibrobacterota bacterium]
MVKIISAVFFSIFAVFPESIEVTGINESLKWGFGARSIALGEASAADRGNVASIYYNPAGLSEINRPSLLLSHSEQRDGFDSDYDIIAGAFPLFPENNSVKRKISAGFGIIRSHIGGIEDTRGLSYRESDGEEGPGAYDDSVVYDQSKIKMISASDYAFLMSGGIKVNDKITTGITFKLYRRFMAGEKATGLSSDIGVSYDALKDLRASLVLRDFPASYLKWTTGTSEKQETGAFLGASWKKKVNYLYGTISFLYETKDLISGQGDNMGKADYIDPDIKISEDFAAFFAGGLFGFEYSMADAFFIRLAPAFINKENTSETALNSFGAGISLFQKRIHIDYAMINANYLGASHRISLNYVH